MQRLSSWLVVLLAVAVFAAAGYVITKKDPVPDAGKILPVPSISAPQSPGSSASTTASKVVAFLGDDWISGVGASTKAKRFTSLLAQRLGFVEKNFGSNGSGYAKSGADDGTYLAQVDDVVAAKPDVVIVSGGRNDTEDYLPTVRGRIKVLFKDLHNRLPQAALIALAPMWGDSEPPTDLQQVGAAVQESVQAAGGSYVDFTDPVRGHPEYMADDADPNNKGYAAIASALAPKIRSLLA